MVIHLVSGFESRRKVRLGGVSGAASGLPTITMKLTEALKVIQAPRMDAPPFDVALVCGFTHLHFETFLQAQLRLQFRDRTPRVKTGLYGDLVGSLERLHDVSAAVVVIEWTESALRVLRSTCVGRAELSRHSDIAIRNRRPVGYSKKKW